MTDEHESNVEEFEIPDIEEKPEPDKVEYVEFVGDAKYGTTYSVGHSVSRKHMKEYHDLTMPKDLEWTKGKNGRFLVPVSDMSPEVVDVLTNDPMFKQVTL